MELTIKGTPEEIKKALQVISINKETLSNHDNQKLNKLLNNPN